MKKYNLSKIMKRAWSLVRKMAMEISSALKYAWMEAKEEVEKVKNAVIKHYDSYNFRRYSTPWVCAMTEDGKYDFSIPVGTYSAEKGKAGDLVVFEPVKDQVYGYGQKDYRGGNTEKSFVKWNGMEFVECDKLGR